MGYWGLTPSNKGFRRQEMNSEPDWAAQAEQFQQSLGQNWTQALSSFQGLGTGIGMPAVPPQLSFSPEKLQALQQAYLREVAELWNHGLKLNPAIKDKSFASDAWAGNPVAAFSAGVYLLNARALLGLVEAADTDAKTKARLRFAVEQFMAASAPSNFMCLNAEAQKKAIETNGESIARGMQNLLKDIQQGYVSMTDERVFQAG